MNEEEVAKLAAWWWSLTAEQRQELREEVLRRYHTDPVFSMQVRRLLWDQIDKERDA